ncbi:coilin-like isoform X2 [Phalaenopsis equestris]|uniref:coilin-like isoform X2 n=1 Tax=Phalaenopsis equestris TaxID=78828 RepID=UPI0009E39472|nr:coilin-like isoform X2 [Phalaenopsis equestris]
MRACVRLRVVFVDVGILSGSQRRRGLQKCWLQLRPDIVTIADLVAHLQVTFGLHSSCPHGLIISIDGFVLPSFESVCILKNEDVIMIKKNGVMFQDVVKFCGSHNQEQILQSRQTSAFNNMNLASMDPQLDSQGDQNDTVLSIRGTIHIETSSKRMKENGKRKRSNKLQGSNNTLAGKNSQRDSLGDEENVGLHGNKARKENTSNEMVKAKRKKKISGELQTTDTSANRDFQADSQIDKGDLGLSIPHIDTSSEIKLIIKGKHKLQGSADTLAIKDFQGYSNCDEENIVFHGDIVSLRTASYEMMNEKSKENHTSKHQASEYSQRVSPGDKKEVGLPNGNIAHTETPREITSLIKRKHSNKLQPSENESKGNDDGHEPKINATGDVRKLPGKNARLKKAKRLWYQTFGSKIEKKVLSRSAYRKKFKRFFYRKFGSKKTKKLIKNETENEIVEGNNQEKPLEHANADQNSNVDEEMVPVINDEEIVPVINDDEEIVPVIVRPGHIHFVPSDMVSAWADQPVKTFQWNGTISKKKGIKWGRQNTSNKWNDDTSNATAAELDKVSNEDATVENVDVYGKSIVNQVEAVKECNGNSVAKEFEEVKELLEFESFPPLVRLPEEGDVLIYRMVELSSTWCPELSPFRVGKVSSYDCGSSKVVLLPLPEYPITLEEVSEEGQENGSSYEEDGTLAVDFASLLDVRLLEATESIKTTPSTISVEELQNAVLVNNQEMQTSAPRNSQESVCSISSNRIEISSEHTENHQLSDGWAAINQALEEKKSQLEKQNDSDERNSSLTATKTGAWSYRAMRRNALGPTLAMLRSSSGDSDK